jgi:prephenate dehydrogenase
MTAPTRITIAGLGLMGGSLARALRTLATPPVVHAVDVDAAVLRDALDERVVDAAHGSLQSAPPSDLLVLCVPVDATLALLREGGAALLRHALITDVASVKAAVHRAADAAGIAERFVGSHPLCGDHRSGFVAARADLYHGSVVYVTTPAPPHAIAAVHAFWAGLGCRVRDMDAAAHDELVARTSHLPQAAAAMLAAALADLDVPAAELGRGGRDTTRIAASDAALWTGILTHNREALAAPLAALERRIGSLRRALDEGDAATVRDALQRGSTWRRTAP